MAEGFNMDNPILRRLVDEAMARVERLTHQEQFDLIRDMIEHMDSTYLHAYEALADPTLDAETKAWWKAVLQENMNVRDTFEGAFPGEGTYKYAFTKDQIPGFVKDGW